MIQGRCAKSLTRLLTLLGAALGSVAFVEGQGIPAIPTANNSASHTSAFEQPLAWLQEARHNFSAVKDYTCTLSKRENIGGRLSDEHIIDAKFRNQPFSVYMRWLAPSKLYGQELAFVQVRNNNKLRVHSKGLIKGAVGFVTVDLNDRRIMEHTRHSIYEAGIGNLIEQAMKYVEVEKDGGKGQARVSETVHDKRPVFRVEIVRAERRPQFDYYRTVLYLDKDSKMPVRGENYDWPRPGSASAGGELTEQVSFTNLRWNVGLGDRDFNK